MSLVKSLEELVHDSVLDANDSTKIKLCIESFKHINENKEPAYKLWFLDQVFDVIKNYSINLNFYTDFIEQYRQFHFFPRDEVFKALQWATNPNYNKGLDNCYTKIKSINWEKDKDRAIQLYNSQGVIHPVKLEDVDELYKHHLFERCALLAECNGEIKSRYNNTFEGTTLSESINYSYDNNALNIALSVETSTMGGVNEKKVFVTYEDEPVFDAKFTHEYVIENLVYNVVKNHNINEEELSKINTDFILPKLVVAEFASSYFGLIIFKYYPKSREWIEQIDKSQVTIESIHRRSRFNCFNSFLI